MRIAPDTADLSVRFSAKSNDDDAFSDVVQSRIREFGRAHEFSETFLEYGSNFRRITLLTTHTTDAGDNEIKPRLTE